VSQGVGLEVKLAAGCIGGYHAANFAFKHPDGGALVYHRRRF